MENEFWVPTSSNFKIYRLSTEIVLIKSKIRIGNFTTSKIPQPERGRGRPKKVTTEPPKPKRPVGRPPKNMTKANENSQADTQQSSEAGLSQARPLLSFFMNDPVMRRCEEASQMELRCSRY